jgi:hypothetical protein
MQAQAICLLVSRIAKGGTGMVAIAGQMLNLVLEDLKLNRDLKVNRVTQTLNVQAGSNGPFTLETDYLRTYDLFYPIPSGIGTAGIPQFLHPITMEQYDAEFKDPGLSEYPYEFATDLSTQAKTASASKGYLWIYPQANVALGMTHRYMRDQPDITNPESSTGTPWFTFTDYLITAAAGRMMGVTGDDRHTEYMAEADKMLRPHLIMEGDEQQTVKTVKLDPRHFRANRAVRVTKHDPF